MLAIVVDFRRYTGTETAPSQRVYNAARKSAEEWIFVSGSIDFFLFDKSPDLVGDVAKGLMDVLDTGGTQVYPHHL